MFAIRRCARSTSTSGRATSARSAAAAPPGQSAASTTEGASSLAGAGSPSCTASPQPCTGDLASAQATALRHQTTAQAAAQAAAQYRHGHGRSSLCSTVHMHSRRDPDASAMICLICIPGNAAFTAFISPTGSGVTSSLFLPNLPGRVPPSTQSGAAAGGGAELHFGERANTTRSRLFANCTG